MWLCLLNIYIYTYHVTNRYWYKSHIVSLSANKIIYIYRDSNSFCYSFPGGYIIIIIIVYFSTSNCKSIDRVIPVMCSWCSFSILKSVYKIHIIIAICCHQVLRYYPLDFSISKKLIFLALLLLLPGFLRMLMPHILY